MKHSYEIIRFFFFFRPHATGFFTVVFNDCGSCEQTHNNTVKRATARSPFVVVTTRLKGKDYSWLLIITLFT